MEPAPAPAEEAEPPELDAWLAKIGMSDYSAQLKEYGYDRMSVLHAASEADITEMMEDPDVKMKKPHRKLFLAQWKALMAADGGGGGGGGGGGSAAAAAGGGSAQRTFANSNFKREYDESGIVPITKAAQIISKISDFIHVYCHVHGLTSELQKVAAETFVDRLQKEAVRVPSHFSGDV